MGRIVDLELNFDALLRYADSAFDKGDVLSAIQNLNEAYDLADDDEKKARLFKTYVKCFRTTGNSRSLIDAVAKEVVYTRDDDYYRFDFSARDPEPVEYEEELSYDDVKKYNTAKHYIFDRKYDEAMAILADVPTDYHYLKQIVEALSIAVDVDKKLNLDKYAIPLIGIMAGAPDQVEMLGMMLEGGRATHNIMVDSADFLLEEEDPDNLCMMGMAYFRGNEPTIAAKFFKKTLDIDPIDEDALYYLSMISVLTNKREDGKKYWDRYKAVYKRFGAPIDLMERFFDSEESAFLVPYMTLPFQFAEKVSVELISEAQKEDVTQEYADKFYDFAILGQENFVMRVMDKLGKITDKPILTKTYLKILATTRSSVLLKQKIFDKLVTDGYEGEVLIATEAKVTYLNVTKIHRRVNRNWEMIYRMILRNLPFSDAYIPIKCSILSAIIKKLDGLFVPDSDEDMAFAVAMALVNYIHRLKVNVDILSLVKAINIEPEVMQRGVEKFNLNGIFV